MMTGMYILCLLMAMPAIPAERDTTVVEVKGIGSDARFEPAVVLVEPGDVILFLVREGIHTVTAYHPDNRRPLRIPAKAAAFNSGMLQPGQQWTLEINNEGVYDYFCLPHERMGHAARILSGDLNTLTIPNYEPGSVPEPVSIKLQQETRDFFEQINQNPKRSSS